MLDASLLGLDISGFTALSERLAARGKLGAEELIVLISRCYSGLIDIAERHGGDVLKFRGDALLLLFEGDGHEERAARVRPLAMQVFIAEDGPSESSVGPVTLGDGGGARLGAVSLLPASAGTIASWSSAGRRHPPRSSSRTRRRRARSSSLRAPPRRSTGARRPDARDGAFLLRPDAPRTRSCRARPDDARRRATSPSSCPPRCAR